MRIFLIVMTLVACAPTPRESTYGAASSNTDDEPRVLIRPLERHQVVRQGAVGDLLFTATPYGASGWRIHIANNGNGVASIHWDESTLVLNDGSSAGRLIRGETRKIDTGKAQPTTPVAPGATINATAFPETLLDEEATESNLATLPAVSQNQADRVETLRGQFYAGFIGAKLVVTFEVNGAKATWTGVVESTLPAQGSAAQGSGLEQP